VEAMRQGAYDFITKPFDHDALIIRIEKALERSHLIQENNRLRRECAENDGFQGILGKSPAMRRVFATIQMVAKTDLTVLITGESGTGKDLTARALHALSDRSQGSFVPVNCPTVPENILESELFGYKKGAFTHAIKNRTGLFQEADGGSIFLDEIGDVSTAIQTKLLRVLQEKEIKPLGDNRVVKVDVRIIASTNQNLKEKIKQGAFREDFFYRLSVLPIAICC
jgi:DNA-binding NtrC family response regulator